MATTTTSPSARSTSRCSRPAGAGGRCCWSTASPGPRRTSATGSTPSPTRAGGSWPPTCAATAPATSPPTRPATRSTMFATDLLALADDLGWDRFSPARPLHGRHDRPGVVLDAPRAGRAAGAHGHQPRPGRGPRPRAGRHRRRRAPHRGHAGAARRCIDAAARPDRAPSEQRVRDTRDRATSSGTRPRSAACSPGDVRRHGHRARQPPRPAGRARPAHRARSGWWSAPRTATSWPPAQRMADAIPAADLVVIPDAAHSPQFENPDAWWDAVPPFLAAATARTPVDGAQRRRRARRGARRWCRAWARCRRGRRARAAQVTWYGMCTAWPPISSTGQHVGAHRVAHHAELLGRRRPSTATTRR